MTTSKEPQNISKTDWYYEFPSYLLMVHEVRDAVGNHVRTDQFKLPWRMIETSRRRLKARKTSA